MNIETVLLGDIDQPLAQRAALGVLLLALQAVDLGFHLSQFRVRHFIEAIDFRHFVSPIDR